MNSGKQGIGPFLVSLQPFLFNPFPWTAGNPDGRLPSQHGNSVAFLTQDVVCSSEVTVAQSFGFVAYTNEHEDETQQKRLFQYAYSSLVKNGRRKNLSADLQLAISVVNEATKKIKQKEQFSYSLIKSLTCHESISTSASRYVQRF